jgi:hypothetical protein
MTTFDDAFDRDFGAARTHAKRHKRSGQQNNSQCESWDDPDWSILDDRRGELPEFPIDTLSGTGIDWVSRAAHGAGVTVDHVAVPLLGIVSSLIGTARRIMPSRSWSEPLTLWAAIVGFSGTGKTPGINTTKRALSQVERNRKAQLAELQRAHEAKVETAKAARNKWKEEIKQAAEGGVVSLDKFRTNKAAEPPMPIEAVDPGPFVAPRLYVSDSTIERLAVLLQARPQGMLLLADELAGLFLNMSRYSGGQDNEFWLEAWCGGPYRVERMNRPSVELDHLLVGLVGGLQPDKLARSFDGDLDGMYARCCFAWPADAPYRMLTDEVTEVEPEIVNALTRLVNLEGGQSQDGEFAPRVVPLSTSARESFENFRQFVHDLKQGLDGRERDWCAKMPAHVIRLAGTLSYLDWAMTPALPEPKEIEIAFMEAAVRLVRDYFWPHARAALRQIGLSARHANGRRVLRWVKANKKQEVSTKDVRRDALAQSLDKEQTITLLNTLVQTGWLREVTAKTGTRGQPPRRWAVNPTLYAENAENAENSPHG